MLSQLSIAPSLGGFLKWGTSPIPPVGSILYLFFDSLNSGLYYRQARSFLDISNKVTHATHYLFPELPHLLDPTPGHAKLFFQLIAYPAGIIRF